MQDDFNKQLTEAGGKLVVVDFYATWCGPCKQIAPKIEVQKHWINNKALEVDAYIIHIWWQVMSKEFTDVVFIKVDVDECEDVASEYNISCMPTFLFLKSGSKVTFNN